MGIDKDRGMHGARAVVTAPFDRCGRAVVTAHFANQKSTRGCNRAPHGGRGGVGVFRGGVTGVFSAAGKYP